MWILATGMIFHLACWIYVWPAILQGGLNSFWAVHASNVLAISVTILVLAPPTRFLLGLTELLLNT
jgi:hypothetical protein